MTNIEAVLLALLYEKDLYGYEIEQIIADRQMRNWTQIGFSSIYNSLSILEKKDIIHSYYKKEYGSPKRKIYHLAENKKQFVVEMIKTFLSTPKRDSSEFTLGMSFSHYLTKEEVQKSIMIYRQRLVDRKMNIQKRYAEQPNVKNNLHLIALFTRPVKLIDAEIEWIDEFIYSMKEENSDY